MKWLALAICIWSVAAVVAVVAVAHEPLAQHLLQHPAIDQDIINTINSDASATWTAGVNSKFEHATLGEVKRLLGVLPGGEKLPPKPDALKLGAAAPPASFDWRTHALAAKCPSLNEVRDQSDCGSCWAFGAAEAITDRICIASNGTKQFHISAADLTACCSSCGDGCNGGYLSAAFSYWKKTGLHTGGNYNNTLKDNGCFPYPFAQCAHHVNSSIYPPCPSTSYDTPACPATCSNSESWATAVSKASSTYSLPFASASEIASEIYNHGPVEASYKVYQDFLTYKSGVYSHITGSYLGGHAIKILGWGTENKVAYWLVANSWNEDWGDHGYFKIKKGKDECGIEDGVVAGLP